MQSTLGKSEKFYEVLRTLKICSGVCGSVFSFPTNVFLLSFSFKEKRISYFASLGSFVDV